MSKRNDKALWVHDLVLLESSDISAACLAQPDWVKTALEQTPWVVVRRETAPAGTVAVGVRGDHRQQRWGGFVARSSIVGIVRADQLRSPLLDPNRRPLPALQMLESMERQLADRDLLWGPVGSVGFELATGRPTTRPESDLDLVIYAPQPLEKAVAREILAVTRNLPGKVDMKVETPFCGFSLEEYVSDQGSSILLRMPEGPRLGLDPWAPPTEEGY